jgi:pimeloyl-ACP methyl ester carboxylesterase
MLVWHAWRPAQGAAHATPVVLLHGGSGSWTHWVRNIQPLVDAGRTVWAVDLPGFGDSAPPPGGEDADAMPEPLEQGLQQLIGDTPVDLVGFSFGGMVAGLLTAAYPARVRRLVLVGAPALGVVESRKADLRGWRHLQDPAERDAMHRHNLAALMLSDARLVDDEALAIHRANVVRDKLPRRRLAFTRVLADALGQIRCPVFAIYGDRDAIYLGVTDQLAAALPAASPTFQGLTWIAGVGHWVQYEDAPAFNRTLATLLTPR